MIIIFRLSLSDSFQRVGQIRVAKELTGAGRFAARHKDFEPFCILGPAVGFFPQFSGHRLNAAPGQRGQGLALPGIADGGRHYLAQRQAAVGFVDRGPGCGSAGHSDRLKAQARHFFASLVQHGLQIKGPTHDAGGIHAVKRTSFLAENRKSVAAGSVGLGFQHRQAGGGRNGGVKGVAPLLEHIQPRLSGQMVGGRAHPPRRVNGIPPGRVWIQSRLFQHFCLLLSILLFFSVFLRYLFQLFFVCMANSVLVQQHGSQSAGGPSVNLLQQVFPQPLRLLLHSAIPFHRFPINSSARLPAFCRRGL